MYVARSRYFKARPFASEDASVVSSWMSTSPFNLFMISSSLSFPVRPETLIDNMQRANQDEHKFYTVLSADSDNYAGYFEIKNISRKNRVGTGAHITLAPEYRGRGLGKDFIQLISRVGFAVLELYRISLSVHTTNHSAICAYIKAGYVFEGLIRDVLSIDGERYSLYQMSLLLPEWEKQSLL